MILLYRRAVLFVALLATACAGEPPRPAETASRDASPAEARPAVLLVGTSLTAGLGVDPDEAYPAILQEKLDSAGLPYRVVNAGVSGETSAGALRRLDWVLRQRVAVLVIETGANDGLRGLPPDTLLANLEAMVARARRETPPPEVILAGMEAPPNLGARYTGSFREVFPEAARKTGAALVPFLLDGVAGFDSLNQADGIHPTPEGHRRMAENVWPALRRALGAE